MTHAPMRSARVRGRRLFFGVAAATMLVTGGVSVANAQVEVPGRVASSSAAAPAAAAAAPSAPETTAAAGTTTTRTVAVRLKLGSRGAAVRDLQRALRKRGYRQVTVDGAFGPKTRAAVRSLQKRWRMRVSGVADTKLLKRLGLQTRRVASAPAVSSTPSKSPYLDLFPVQGEYSYFDDYGAGRRQGAHQGTDIMADKGTPLVAVTDAKVDRVQRVESGLGGIYVWLERPSDGTEYYYAHMSSITAGLEAGQKVKAGQIIGTVGNTGDARYGAHHLHFEIRLAGNRTINPYPHLVAVDPTRNNSAARTR